MFTSTRWLQRDDRKKVTEFYLLRYNVVEVGERQLTFRKNTLCPSTGSESKPNNNQAWSRTQAEHSCSFLAWLILRSWRWWRYVLQKRRLTFTRLHGVIKSRGRAVGIATGYRLDDRPGRVKNFHFTM
jgi:hypothetical protein